MKFDRHHLIIVRVVATRARRRVRVRVVASHLVPRMSIASTIARANARTHRRRARDASPRTSPSRARARPSRTPSRARETVCFASEPDARRPLDDAVSVFLRRGRLAPIAFDLAPVVAVAVRAFASSDALVASANAVLLFWLAQVCDSEHILCLDRRVYFYICSSAFELTTFCTRFVGFHPPSVAVARRGARAAERPSRKVRVGHRRDARFGRGGGVRVRGARRASRRLGPNV